MFYRFDLQIFNTEKDKTTFETPTVHRINYVSLIPGALLLKWLWIILEIIKQSKTSKLMVSNFYTLECNMTIKKIGDISEEQGKKISPKRQHYGGKIPKIIVYPYDTAKKSYEGNFLTDSKLYMYFFLINKFPIPIFCVSVNSYSNFHYL